MATETQQHRDPSSVPPPLTVDTASKHETAVSPDSLSPPSRSKSRSDSLSVLQSSRPAPPSPASSRPNSQLFFHSPNLGPSSPRDRSGSQSSSRISSGMHRRASGASSRLSEKDKASRRKSTLGQNFSLPLDEAEGAASSQATSTGQSTPQDNSLASTPIPEDVATPAKPEATSDDHTANVKKPIPVLTVVIRDYAFPSTDERFFGRGQVAPTQKAKWRFSGFTLGRRPSGADGGSGTSTPRSPDPNAAAGEGDERKGWGFGFLGWRGFGRKRSVSSESNSQKSAQIHDEPEDTDDVDDDDYYSDDHDDEGEEPFGMYKAAYAFEAEGEHEMSVAEGEVIEVRGRGGGDGWVIGVKAGQEGLVPEGYLERYVANANVEDDDDDIEELQDTTTSTKAA